MRSWDLYVWMKWADRLAFLLGREVHTGSQETTIIVGFRTQADTGAIFGDENAKQCGTIIVARFLNAVTSGLRKEMTAYIYICIECNPLTFFLPLPPPLCPSLPSFTTPASPRQGPGIAMGNGWSCDSHAPATKAVCERKRVLCLLRQAPV